MDKVECFWRGYRFRFLLILGVLHVHEIGPFMPNSSVFIELMFECIFFFDALMFIFDGFLHYYILEKSTPKSQTNSKFIKKQKVFSN